MTRPYAGIRQTIANLGRPDLAVLSQALGVSRDVLTDFADIGIEPGADILAKLESWYEIVSLRRAANAMQNARVRDNLPAGGAVLAKGAGISISDYDAFLAGETDLDADRRASLRDFVAAGGAPLKPGAVRENGAAPATHKLAAKPAALTNGAPLPAHIRAAGRRAAAFAALPADEQERLLGLARPAA